MQSNPRLSCVLGSAFMCLALMFTPFVGGAAYVPNTASFDSTSALSEKQQEKYAAVLVSFFYGYENKHAAAYLYNKYNTVNERVAAVLTQNLEGVSLFVMEYISRYVQGYMDWYETQNELEDDDDATEDGSDVTDDEDAANEDTGNDADDTQSDEDIRSARLGYYSGPKTILAGEKSTFLTKIELVAQGEKIMLEDLRIIADHDDFADAVASVEIYNEFGQQIITRSARSSAVEFANVNWELELGSNYFYVGVTPEAMGYGSVSQESISFTLSMEVDKAEGMTSRKRIPSTTVVNPSDVTTIVPVLISEVDFVDSFQNYYADDLLYNYVKTDLALIRLMIPETQNKELHTNSSVDIALQYLDILVEDETSAGNIASTMRLQRIDSQSNEITAKKMGNYVRFDLSQLSTAKNVIEPGREVVFIVTGTPTLQSTSKESVALELDNEELPQGVVSYKAHGRGSEMYTTQNMSPSYRGKVVVSEG